MTIDAQVALLAERGPPRDAPPVTLEAARAYCRQLAREHYENFSVASWLLPRRLRPHFHAIYAYCRWADDLADEVGDPERSRQLLDWWEAELRACYRGDARHPVFVALRETILQTALPMEPLVDLLSAFRQDQQTHRYETWDDLLDYCRRSANPVGRLILHLAGLQDPVRVALADQICTGLQLANFWQDVARDWDLGRVYLPAEDRRRFGMGDDVFEQRRATPEFRQLLRFEVDRAERLLWSGQALAEQTPRWLGGDVRLFAGGGLAILANIRRANFDVWTARPTVTAARKLALLAGSCAWRLRRTWPRPAVSELAPESPRRVSTDDSYVYCAERTRQSGSNFRLAMALLPRDQRRAMHALYAYLRHTDDLGDNLSPVGERRAALAAWRARTAAALAGDPSGPLLPALADAAQRFQIPSNLLTTVIDGVETDLGAVRFTTFADLADYCRQVAGVVGLACLRIWGVDNPAAEHPALQCGLAFQLTNILRDLREDATESRVYLPQEDLHRFGCTDEDLFTADPPTRVLELVRFEVERAAACYREAERLLPMLDSAAARTLRAMLGAYRRLLDEIARRDGDVFRERIRLSRAAKIRVLGRAIFPTLAGRNAAAARSLGTP